MLDPGADTFPKLALHNAARWPSKVAIREKDLGIWLSYTWREYCEQARLIALGLAALGFTRGDKTAVVGVTSGLIRGDICFWGSLMAACLVASLPIATVCPARSLR